jgi:hypothetical protein
MTGHWIAAALGSVVVILTGLACGPISSGTESVRSTLVAQKAPGVPDGYVPRHKGGIDLGSGLYTREDEDLLVRGTPGLVLRRTYLSRDRQSRHFGIGATHNGERYLISDGDRFQWAELILPMGTRIRFERVSAGTSFVDAVYEDRSRSSEFRGAKLAWSGTGWSLRRDDGSLLLFQPCGPGIASVCAIGRHVGTVYVRSNTVRPVRNLGCSTNSSVDTYVRPRRAQPRDYVRDARVSWTNGNVGPS